MKKDKNKNNVIPFKLLKNKIKKVLGFSVPNNLYLDTDSIIKLISTTPLFREFRNLHPDSTHIKWDIVESQGLIVGINFHLIKGEKDA